MREGISVYFDLLGRMSKHDMKYENLKYVESLKKKLKKDLWIYLKNKYQTDKREFDLFTHENTGLGHLIDAQTGFFPSLTSSTRQYVNDLRNKTSTNIFTFLFPKPAVQNIVSKQPKRESKCTK